MKFSHRDWVLLRPATIAAVLMLSAASYLGWASTAFRAQAEVFAESGARQLQAATNDEAQREGEAPRLQQQLAAYARWQDEGWDDPGRVQALSSRLQAYAEARQLPGLQLQVLGPPKPFTSGTGRLAWLATPSRLALSGGHEGDLLALLAQLTAAGGLPAIVHRCRLTRTETPPNGGSVAAIDAECDIDWLHIAARQGAG